MEYIIETSALSHRFGNRLVVDALALQASPASIYGFLGPNGAGKTTTIRMLLGLIQPAAGDIWLFGLPLKYQRQVILQQTGSLVETPSLYPHLTGQENLAVIQKMVGGSGSEIDRVLGIVGMRADARRLVREYSLGMRQRLALAVALLNNPRLLILDEPTNGLDPAGICEIRELIKSLPLQEGTTVFISSHLLHEVEQMASAIGIIHRGRLIFQGTPDRLRSRYQDRLWLCSDRLPEARFCLEQHGWQVLNSDAGRLELRINSAGDAAAINTDLVQAGFKISYLQISQPALEDIFLILTEEKEEI